MSVSTTTHCAAFQPLHYVHSRIRSVSITNGTEMSLKKHTEEETITIQNSNKLFEVFIMKTWLNEV